MDSANFLGHRLDKEFSLYHVGHDNASPELQSNFVHIDGKNGDIDLTEQDGAVFYNSIDREWRFEKVTRKVTVDDVDAFARELRRVFGAKQGRFIFDSDPGYYYYGRVKSIDVSCEGNGRLVALFVVRVEPYKYMVDETNLTFTINTSGTIVLNNKELIVCPTVINSATMTLAYTIRGTSYSTTIQQGTHIIDTLILYEGATTISVTGSGTIQFKYRQGAI